MTPPEHGHTHRLPRTLLAMIGICIIGLLAAVVLVLLYAQNVDHRLGRLEQYVQGRGEFRDQEQQRLEEQLRRSTCDLLDQLPEGGLLVQPRQKYHCGPGIPRAKPTSPPHSAATPGAAGTPAAPPATRPPAPAPASAVPSAPAPARAAPPAGQPSPTAKPTPVPLPSPICAVLGACR